MEVFEIHITGDASILEAAKPIKTISVQLLTPKGEIIRTEYMTSLVMKAENYEACKIKVDEIAASLAASGVQISRVKIECPFYKHYADRAIYIESHFVTQDFKFPVSRNARKDSLLATDRTYIRAEFESFKERYKGVEVELCLYDTWVDEDLDWFKLYQGAL